MKRLTICLWAISVSAVADIYRWTDDTGKVHFSDQPPPQLSTSTQRPSASEPPEIQRIQQQNGNFYMPRVPAALPKSSTSLKPAKKRKRASRQTVSWSDNQCRTAKLRERSWALKKSQGDLQTVRLRREKLRQLRQKIRQRC
ncbi:hypothetical protein CHH28_17275 [Bacterioplanes sanyensis]|uniref:DUF4124 domain-containing protein n=1 Tax=Bacterioplanes sanyensis TaxID=1249553 RepID=A0A222FNF0_9GAMM|nr:DUF4124 domain-containing protein [Bacterioplanes sanyensis]ASP40320.1 hypothetical protein CHH28_17275 [Bacterioplanes sanyensis]